MKVPERPTPALQCTTMGRCSGLTRSRNARTNLQPHSELIKRYFSQLSTNLNVVFTWLGFAGAPARQSPAKWWSESDEWFALRKINISYIREFCTVQSRYATYGTVPTSVVDPDPNPDPPDPRVFGPRGSGSTNQRYGSGSGSGSGSFYH